MSAVFAHFPLETIDFLHDDDRDDHVVVAELEDRLWIKQQDVRVQDKCFTQIGLHAGAHLFAP